MKIAQFVLLVVAVLFGCTTSAALAEAHLPDSGTYFILASSGDALQALAASPGQNVLVFPFNKSGLQKWTVTRKIDPATKQPTNRYNIRCAGEATGLNFRPYVMPDHTPMIGDPSVMVLKPAGEGLLVKSVELNGDALYTYSVPDAYTEGRFGAADGSSKFIWSFVPVSD